MRTLAVVMLHVGPKDPFEVATTQHQDVIQALRSDPLNPPLGVGARLRGAAVPRRRCRTGLPRACLPSRCW
jgi:hypothetical protein